MKKLAGVILTVFLAGTCACLRKAAPRPELPEPTGPYRVGTVWLSFVDPARPETFTAEPEDRREIFVRLWYPAGAGGAGQACRYAEPGVMTPDPGLPPALRDAMAKLDKRLSSIKTRSLRDVPVAAGGRFPVVLYSHGYWAGMNQSTVLMEELASRGYVAASIGHPFETNSVTRPDGRLIRFDPRNPEFMLRGRERQAGLPLERAIVGTTDPDRIDGLFRELGRTRPKMLESLTIWAADIRFAIDRLEEMDRSDGRFRGRLDLGGVGVLGHSFGGAASGQAALEDGRIAAGINMDGLQMGDMVDRAVEVPFLFLHHDNRPDPNPAPNINLFRRAKGPAYLLVIKGSGHYNFSDLSLPLLSEGVPLPEGALGPIEGRRAVEILNRVVVAFFDAYLRKGDPAGFIEALAHTPEIEVFPKQAAVASR
jgi:predicted dienelactone hydrolase